MAMNDLTPDARAILDAGRDQDGAGDLEKARVRRALFAKIAAGGAVLGAASTAAADSGATAAGSGAGATGAATSGGAAMSTYAAVATPLAKILIPLAVIVGGAAGGFVAWRAQHTLGPAPAPVVTPAAPALPAPAPPIAPVVEPVPAPPAARPAPAPAHRVHVAAPPRAEAVAPTNRLAEETALLAAANGELRRGDARRALSLLDDYDHRYPSGVLREEVLATRVIARCQLGSDRGARRAADAFLARHPASPLATRVRTSCGQ
jgi:hypothetical protein